MYRHISYEAAQPAAVITLNRPDKLNAWTMLMDREVRAALLEAEADPKVVGIIVTGAGRAFCSGADMSMLDGLTRGQGPDTDDLPPLAHPGDGAMSDSFRKTYSMLASVRKPVIAAVNGPCVGMALPISLYCDLRFASENAIFISAFAQRGLIAEHGVAWMLPRLVGLANSMDILLSSRKISADEAERMGLVNRVIRDGDLLTHCREYVAQLAATCAPGSMAKIKRQVYHYLEQPLDAAYDESEALMMSSFGEEDFKEGVAAFMEKRAPCFPRIGKP